MTTVTTTENKTKQKMHSKISTEIHETAKVQEHVVSFLSLGLKYILHLTMHVIYYWFCVPNKKQTLFVSLSHILPDLTQVVNTIEQLTHNYMIL